MRDKTVRVLCTPIQKIGEKALIPRAPPRPHAHMDLYFAQGKRLQMWNSFLARNNSNNALKNWGKHQNNEKFNFSLATKQNHYCTNITLNIFLKVLQFYWQKFEIRAGIRIAIRRELSSFHCSHLDCLWTFAAKFHFGVSRRDVASASNKFDTVFKNFRDSHKLETWM